MTGYSQHSMGLEATCSDSVRPLGCGMCTRNTSRTRVFFLPMSVSPLRSSMSEFRSFRIPAQSMLPKTRVHCLPVPTHWQDARPRRSTRLSPPGRTDTSWGQDTPCRLPGQGRGAVQTTKSLLLWFPVNHLHRCGQAHSVLPGGTRAGLSPRNPESGPAAPSQS